jgi:hypothetical protein
MLCPNSTDVLLPELLVCMILLQLEVPLLLHQVNWIQLLVPLLDTLDKFNRLASGVEKEDAEDLSWPGIVGRSNYVPQVPFQHADSPQVFIINPFHPLLTICSHICIVSLASLLLLLSWPSTIRRTDIQLHAHTFSPASLILVYTVNQPTGADFSLSAYRCYVWKDKIDTLGMLT